MALGGRAVADPRRQGAAGHRDRSGHRVQARRRGCSSAARHAVARPEPPALPPRQERRHHAAAPGQGAGRAHGDASGRPRGQHEQVFGAGKSPTSGCSRTRWRATRTRFGREDSLDEQWRIVDPFLRHPEPVHLYTRARGAPKPRPASPPTAAAGTNRSSSGRGRRGRGRRRLCTPLRRGRARRAQQVRHDPQHPLHERAAACRHE